jgi:hypothetical protein
MDGVIDFVINTICLAVSPDRPEWLLLLGGWSLGRAISSAWNGVTGAVSSAGRAIGNAFGGVGRAVGSILSGGRQPTVSVVGGTSPQQQQANEQAIRALQNQLAEQQRQAAEAERRRQREAAIAAENESAANLQNASIKRASDRLSSLNTAQLAADTAAGNQYSLAMQGVGNVGGGFDINAARLQALSNVGGAGGGALAGASPYLSPSNVAPAVAAAAINQESGGGRGRSNRFNIPSQNLTYGGG